MNDDPDSEILHMGSSMRCHVPCSVTASMGKDISDHDFLDQWPQSMAVWIKYSALFPMLHMAHADISSLTLYLFLFLILLILHSFPASDLHALNQAYSTLSHTTSPHLGSISSPLVLDLKAALF